MRQARRIQPTKLPCLMFTPDELLLLKKSLILLEQMLATHQQHHTNIEFAHETLAHLQIKLYQIMGSFEYGEGVPLDTNEMILLHTSVQLFDLALPSSQQKEKLRCMELGAKLAPL